MKKEKRYLIDVQFSTDKKLARHGKTPMKSNAVIIGSYVGLFLLDFAQRLLVEALYVS